MFSCMVRIPQDIQLLVSVTKLANKPNRNSAVVEPVETRNFVSGLKPAINVAFFVLFKSKSSLPKAKQALVAVWFLCSVVRYCRRVMIKTDLGVVFYEVNKKKETPKLLKL